MAQESALTPQLPQPETQFKLEYPGVRTLEIEQFERDPEPKIVGKLVWLLERFQHLTKRDSSYRTIAERHFRAEKYKQVLKGIKSEDRGDFLKELKGRREVAKAYLNQGLLGVNLEKLGDQITPYVIVEPPEGRRDKRFENRPVVIIPGISNGLAGVETLIKEFAMQGRTVIAIAQPESFRGRVTPEFAAAVENAPGLEPHVEFYKIAILNLLQTRQEQVGQTGDLEFDLVGHSAGSLISAGILNDETFQKMVQNVAFVSPSGLAEQTSKQFDDATGPELFHLIRHNFSNAPYLGINNVKRDVYRERVSEGVKNRIIKKHISTFAGAKVVENMILLSGQRDRIVKSYDGENELKQKAPLIDIIQMKNAAHAEALLHPQKTVGLIVNCWYPQGA